MIIFFHPSDFLINFLYGKKFYIKLVLYYCYFKSNVDIKLINFEDKIHVHYKLLFPFRQHVKFRQFKFKFYFKIFSVKTHFLLWYSFLSFCNLIST